MRTKLLKMLLVTVLGFIISTPPCFAEADGFCYVVAYSYSQKTAIFTPVFMKKVKDKSFNEEEFVADVELIRQMEAAFEKHIRDTMRFSARDLAVSARAAYKSLAIATKRLNSEKQEYISQSWEIKEAAAFNF